MERLILKLQNRYLYTEVQLKLESIYESIENFYYKVGQTATWHSRKVPESKSIVAGNHKYFVVLPSEFVPYIYHTAVDGFREEISDKNRDFLHNNTDTTL